MKDACRPAWPRAHGAARHRRRPHLKPPAPLPIDNKLTFDRCRRLPLGHRARRDQPCTSWCNTSLCVDRCTSSTRTLPALLPRRGLRMVADPGPGRGCRSRQQLRALQDCTSWTPTHHRLVPRGGRGPNYSRCRGLLQQLHAPGEAARQSGARSAGPIRKRRESLEERRGCSVNLLTSATWARSQEPRQSRTTRARCKSALLALESARGFRIAGGHQSPRFTERLGRQQRSSHSRCSSIARSRRERRLALLVATQDSRDSRSLQGEPAQYSDALTTGVTPHLG